METVKIEWEDITLYDEWVPKEDQEDLITAKITTTAFLIAEHAKYITIAHSVADETGNGAACGVLKIPKSNILSWYKLANGVWEPVTEKDNGKKR